MQVRQDEQEFQNCDSRESPCFSHNPDGPVKHVRKKKASTLYNLQFSTLRLHEN